MAEIDNLSIRVTASADEAARTFDRLASSAGRLRGAAQGAAGGMRDMAQGARDAGTATAAAGEQTGQAGTQIGHAESHIRRFARALLSVSSQTVGRFVGAVNRGAVAVGGFIRQIARVLMYRSIRSMIKDVGQSFKDLYGWSRMFGTDFSKSMDRINTSAVYLRNSFAAMVAPIINALAPAIDFIADKIVDIFNFVNQIFAALSGAETYTVAKKVAQSWESTFDSSVDHTTQKFNELKRTILGFDEINKLNGNTPTSTPGITGSSPYTPGYENMFEEKPLEGFFKQVSDFTSKMPDWLKWLFGGTALVGGFLLITKFIPWLIDKIKELFSIKIPDWLKWLFGPKNDGNNGLNIPDHIDIPDADIDVNLNKGDWSTLDEIPDTVYMSPKLDNKPSVLFNNFRDEWNEIPARTLYVSPKLDNTASVLWNLFKKAWEEVGSKILYFSPKLDNTASTLYNGFKKDWDETGNKALYFSPKLDNSASVLVNEFKEAWNKENRTVYLSPKLDNTAEAIWGRFKTEWNSTVRTLYASPKLDNTASALWSSFKSAWDNAVQALKIPVELDYGDGFGGATGGGGSTSGGGAGRYNVPIDIEPPSVEKSKSIFEVWWEELKQNTKFEIGILGRLATAEGKFLSDGANAIMDWIFPHASAEELAISIPVNATPGNGFQSDLGDLALKGIKPANVVVSATVGKGFRDRFWSDGTVNLKGINPVDVVVRANPGRGLNALDDKNQTSLKIKGSSVTITPAAGAGLKSFDSNGATLKGVAAATVTVDATPGNGFLNTMNQTGQHAFTLSPINDATVYIDPKPKDNSGMAKGSSAFSLKFDTMTPTVGANPGSGLKKSGSDAVILNFGTMSPTVTASGEWSSGTDPTIKNALKSTKLTKTIEFNASVNNKVIGGGDDGLLSAGGDQVNLLDNLKTIQAMKATTKRSVSLSFSATLSGSNSTLNNLLVTDGVEKELTLDPIFKSDPTSASAKAAIVNKKGSYSLEVNPTWGGNIENFGQRLGKEIAKGFNNNIRKASGGAYYSSSWHDFASGGYINAYAGGTANAHGSLFLAGEAGPEIVGHVGGRTEVLNRSQLAATMFAAVRSAMSGVKISGSFFDASAMGGTEADYETMYSAMYDAFTAAMARGDERDREKVELLRMISEKDFNPEISTADLNRAQTRMNRRAGTTIVPVGT